MQIHRLGLGVNIKLRPRFTILILLFFAQLNFSNSGQANEQNVVIRTERTLIRPLNPNDFDDLVRIYSNPDLIKMSGRELNINFVKSRVALPPLTRPSFRWKNVIAFGIILEKKATNSLVRLKLLNALKAEIALD